MKTLEYQIEPLLQDVIHPALKIHDMQSVSGGCINHASRVNTNRGVYFVKWNQNCPKDLFIREAECLKALSEVYSILSVPGVYAATEVTDELPGMIVMQFLNEVSPQAHEDEALGRGLAMIHQHEQDRFGFNHNTYCGATVQDTAWHDSWSGYFRDRMIGHLLGLLRQSRPVSMDEIQVYTRFMKKIPELIAHNPKPALNHGDLWSGNYLHTDLGPALIDPACMYADREFDLALMTLFGGFSQRVWDAYNEAYPLPAEWRERNQLYQVYHLMNHYYLFGGHYGGQTLQQIRRFL